MYIIVGLGNPGRQYAGTRHNIGFDTVTRLSDDYNIPVNKREHKALCGRGVIEGHKVLLAMPQTFMNLSGDSVRALVDFYKTEPGELIVIYDDISLETGKLRVRKKGSAGGHNGVKDIIAKLGTQEFTRIRIGVGEKPKGWDLADYVLGHFKREEEAVIREALGRAAEAVRTIMDYGADRAMNDFN